MWLLVKKQLSEKTIQNLKPEHNEFIDYEIFREVYKQMVTAKKIMSKIKKNLHM